MLEMQKCVKKTLRTAKSSEKVGLWGDHPCIYIYPMKPLKYPGELRISFQQSDWDNLEAFRSQRNSGGQTAQRWDVLTQEAHAYLQINNMIWANILHETPSPNLSSFFLAGQSFEKSWPPQPINKHNLIRMMGKLPRVLYNSCYV